MREGASLLFGKINFDNSVIELSSTDGTGEERQKITFLHEVLHGIFWHCWSGEDLENEEEIVKTLAKGLYQVLKDNEDALFSEKGKVLRACDERENRT